MDLSKPPMETHSTLTVHTKDLPPDFRSIAASQMRGRDDCEQLENEPILLNHREHLLYNTN